MSSPNPIYRAHSAVWKAVSSGLLLPARNFACVDCGKPARDYDHRDYAKPLAVEPVCRGCNLRRGPALNHPRRPRAKAA